MTHTEEQLKNLKRDFYPSYWNLLLYGFNLGVNL